MPWTQLYSKTKQSSYFNIRWLFNAIYSVSEEVPECIVSLNTDRAFDWVEWLYLFAVLDKFGFGPNLISWIQLLYSRPTASIHINSLPNRPFSLQSLWSPPAHQMIPCFIIWPFSLLPGHSTLAMISLTTEGEALGPTVCWWPVAFHFLSKDHITLCSVTV